ncbi:sensor histidine kinase [Rheinheimera nanhaiensis]|uniref:Two-component system, LytT family, sensor histidine kinase AlgZ n=1 Tax=Rheinheimera nanhaiensis E407-8 TaxID=562729 RepID=I1DUY1_9GAMM|nr:histidine kinase [Rheinheimera nanhaiensis]GAB57859.1 two-component system, LytT family, sensor histidine kinase AlgZ [Rheinheimera nanhaiensis E407-8]
MNLQWALPALQLPYLCHGHFVVRLLVLGQALAVVLAFAPGIHAEPWQRLGLISLFVHWVSLLTTICLCQLRQWLNSLAPVWLLLATVFIFEIATILVSVISHSWLQAQHPSLLASLTGFVLANMMISGIVAVIAIQFFIIHTEHNQQVRSQSQAEFNALQARIEPHFLFNSLNTVAELIHVAPDAAEQALLNLSALFRAALNAGQVISLADELKLSAQYLSLEQWRLGERMTVQWDLPEPVPAMQLPALTIQPLLENAVRHGAEQSQTKAMIHITVLESRRSVSIVITNPLGNKAQQQQRGNGMALDNIRQRLQLHFGIDAQLHSASNEGRFRVKLVLPKQGEA